jgi:oligoendopeptidase F
MKKINTKAKLMTSFEANFLPLKKRTYHIIAKMIGIIKIKYLDTSMGIISFGIPIFFS